MPKRLATHLRSLTDKEEKLDTLLEKYDDAQDTLYESNGGGDGSGCIGMPLVWNMSYRELERVLRRMRDLAVPADVSSPGLRASYVHLCEWYLRATKKRAPLIRKDKKGRDYHVTTANGPQFVIVVVRGGNPDFVMKGLEWVAAEFVGEVYLPKEFLQVAA